MKNNILYYHIICISNSFENILYEHFDINQKGGPDVQTALQYACKFDDMDVVDALLEANADPGCDEKANCPLMTASFEVVRKLLKEGNKGGTVLWLACGNGMEDVVDVFLNANADPNVCDNEDKSPLMIASENGHVQIVRKLQIFG